MSNNYKNPTKVITGPKTRWSYANVWDPKSINGGTPKYSVSLIIPKSDAATVKKIEAAIQAAYEEGESKLKGNGKSVPSLKVLKTPLRDGDLERPDDAAYADSYFIMLILYLHLESWMPIVSQFLNALKYTVVFMDVPASTFMPSIPMAIRVSPAALTICRRLPMVSLLAVSPEQRMILQQMTMMISYPKKGTGDNVWKQHRQFW